MCEVVFSRRVVTSRGARPQMHLRHTVGFMLLGRGRMWVVLKACPPPGVLVLVVCLLFSNICGKYNPVYTIYLCTEFSSGYIRLPKRQAPPNAKSRETWRLTARFILFT